VAIQKADLEAKLREIESIVEETKTQAKNTGVVLAVVVVAVVALSFLFGRIDADVQRRSTRASSDSRPRGGDDGHRYCASSIRSRGETAFRPDAEGRRGYHRSHGAGSEQRRGSLMFRHRQAMQKAFVWVIVIAMILGLLAGVASIFAS
jgi:hypothetical protein